MPYKGGKNVNKNFNLVGTYLTPYTGTKTYSYSLFCAVDGRITSITDIEVYFRPYTTNNDGTTTYYTSTLLLEITGNRTGDTITKTANYTESGEGTVGVNGLGYNYFTGDTITIKITCTNVGIYTMGVTRMSIGDSGLTVSGTIFTSVLNCTYDLIWFIGDSGYPELSCIDTFSGKEYFNGFIEPYPWGIWKIDSNNNGFPWIWGYGDIPINNSNLYIMTENGPIPLPLYIMTEDGPMPLRLVTYKGGE